jgi:transposase-like protein
VSVLPHRSLRSAAPSRCSAISPAHGRHHPKSRCFFKTAVEDESEQKVAILKQALVDEQPISKVCEEHGISPTLFYEWQRIFFEQGAAAFSKDKDDERRRLERENEQLEARLTKKDSVIAEVTAEFVKLKKELGEP